eukprot:m.360386 g.360386  ORF g.360386 m.360386 type:complete len:396 (+) comp19017_c0_seq1:62-1249(+)
MEHSEQNTKLHQQRYRAKVEGKVDKTELAMAVEAERKEFAERRAGVEWAEGHRSLLDEMDVFKFRIAPEVQRLLYRMQRALVDDLYYSWGQTEESWKCYTLMFRNGFPSKDERKPVAEQFQEYLEAVYCPIIWTMLFGEAGWESIRKHWSQFKSCTIKVTESGMAYGDNVFHMHIDGKIGMKEPRNHTQRHMSRLLFSVVSDVGSGKVSAEEADSDPYRYGTTNYLVWQPRKGFGSNHQFHTYMQSLYVERGLENAGLPRPHYEVPEDILYRAKSGEVFINRSHADPEYGCQPIHSEPNPCPDRHFFAFDWKNLPGTGRANPSVDIPEDEIIRHMRCLGSPGSDGYRSRIAEVTRKCTSLLGTASAFPQGCEAIETVLSSLVGITTAPDAAGAAA